MQIDYHLLAFCLVISSVVRCADALHLSNSISFEPSVLSLTNINMILFLNLNITAYFLKNDLLPN